MRRCVDASLRLLPTGHFADHLHSTHRTPALDKPTRPLLSSDWSESDSSIQPLYGKFHALCLPVGGASLANDDVMRGGGAAEIGMWRKQVQ